MRPPLTVEEQDVMNLLLAGHEVPGKAICPCCQARPMRATSKSCRYCVTGHTRNKPGRKEQFTDEVILTLVREGRDTPERLRLALDVRSKSNLMIRLRRLKDAGRITFDEHASGRAHKNATLTVVKKEELTDEVE